MNKFKPGFLFWFLLFMTLGCLSQGNFIGVIIFAALAIWRYVFAKNKFEQTPPPVPPEKADPVSYSSAITPPDTTANQPAPATTISSKEYTSLVDIPNHEITISKDKRNRQKSFPEDSFKYSSITKRGVFEDFTVIDTETTGLAPYRDRIVQIAAIRFRNGEPVEKFCTYINPKRDIPADASAINGITADMVAAAPTFPEIVSDLEAFIGNDNIVGHNLVFDVKFLYYSGSTILDKKRKYLDTYKISKRLVKGPNWRNPDADYDVENHKLPTLLDYYGIPTEESHRADSDALATGYLFNELVEQLQFDREYV